MRILAFSDVHNNLACVRKMRAQETNKFGAIVFAGDIGRKIPEEFFRILSTFECPIFYVFGNWDLELSREQQFHPSARILNESVESLNGIHFAGFSEKADKRSCQRLSKIFETRSIELNRTILLCHYRIASVERIYRGLGLHLFGHTHVKEMSKAHTTRIVNLGVLDRQITVRPSEKPEWSRDDCRNYIAGNYAVIEATNGEFLVRHIDLPHEFPGWTPINRCLRGIPWIPEEEIWASESDPRLPRFEMSL